MKNKTINPSEDTNLMDKKSPIGPIEIASVTPRIPDFSVIRGGVDEQLPPSRVPVYLAMQKLIRQKRLKIQPSHPPLDSRGNRVVKRTVDIFISSIVIVTVLSWLIPLIGLIIRLDSRGPVFFLQRRTGRDGKLFSCIKFRSMSVNAEADVKPAMNDDKRITRVGKFLRDHYIDELPQFINVLFGDMSLIGPRPHMISENFKYEELIEDYDYRHRVKPGITGLAQALGYVGPTSDIRRMEDRVYLDIFYVQRWSPLMDMKIFFRTMFKMTSNA
jgi:putative colanic acid biosysnthesis UDP-glucose lipid carrier transferase